MSQISDFFKRDLFQVNGFHVTVGVVVLVVVVVIVYKAARKR